MKDAGLAFFYAVFVWWFSTGLVLLLVLRQKWIKASLIGAALLFPICLFLVATTSTMTSVIGAYAAFTAAILLWGTQEVAFLTGFMTGPRPLPCPPQARGVERLRHALAAILHHELALIVTGVAVLAVTWNESNQIGALTFLVLWVMRVSAKLNLFLGVPVTNDEVLPVHLAYLRSYFCRGTVNGFFPLAVVGSALLMGAFVTVATGEFASAATRAGYLLLATLTGLAILEHAFMLVPLPIDRLWRWSTGRLSAPDRRETVIPDSPDVKHAPLRP